MVQRAGTLKAYFFGTAATGVKTFAWWFNQWPLIYGLPFMVKWVISASIAGLEYLPLTMAFTTASFYVVHLGLLTAYMEAADNFLRMMQQLGLQDPLGWFDWVAAVGLGLCVAWQGYMHYRSDTAGKAKFAVLASPSDDIELRDRGEASASPDGDITLDTSDAGVSDGEGDDVVSAEEATLVAVPDNSDSARKVYCLGLDKERFMIVAIGSFVLVAGSPAVALNAGPTGEAYVLATLATAAKTFAWWINQYPQLAHLNFWQKWLAGWSIAALIEYFPLIGAMTIAKGNGVHLGVMTAYMEALDNFFRILQQRLLNKPLAWYDYTAAAGMFVCVIFQGTLRYLYDLHDL